MPKFRNAVSSLPLLAMFCLSGVAEADERHGYGDSDWGSPPCCHPSDIQQIGSNTQLTHQSGVGNAATVSQHAMAAHAPEANNAVVLQHGTDNKAAIQQEGEGLNAAIAQFGTNLNARIEQSGDGAGALIVQGGIGSGLPVVVRQH